MVLARIYSDLKGLDCAETAVEAILQEKFSQTPELEDLAKMQADHKKQAYKEWRAKYAQFELK